MDELELMDRIYQDPDAVDAPVELIMGPPLPTIGAGQSVHRAVEMLGTAPALLVLSGGRPRGVLTRSDILNHLGGSVV